MELQFNIRFCLMSHYTFTPVLFWEGTRAGLIGPGGPTLVPVPGETVWRTSVNGRVASCSFPRSRPATPVPGVNLRFAERIGTSSDFLRKELALIGEAVRKLGLWLFWGRFKALYLTSLPAFWKTGFEIGTRRCIGNLWITVCLTQFKDWIIPHIILDCFSSIW